MSQFKSPLENFITMIEEFINKLFARGQEQHIPTQTEGPAQAPGLEGPFGRRENYVESNHGIDVSRTSDDLRGR